MPDPVEAIIASLRDPMEMRFSGFTADSLAFIQELGRNNSKAWLDTNRPRYEAHVQGPFRRLLAALEPALRRIRLACRHGSSTEFSSPARAV
jgi:uncharacterized protein (DUF2461 family)